MAFAISVVLARLLTPEDFGTVALLSVFVALAGVFATAGLTQALIQKKAITIEDESTVFWFTMAAGVILALMLCAAAPFLAAAYDVPVLEPLGYVMAANIVLAAAGAVQQTLMTRRLDFRLLTRIGVVSTVLAGGVAVYFAWIGMGVWAIGAQSIIINFATTIMLWLFNSWRPKFIFSATSFRNLFGYGGYLFAAKILDTGYQRGSALLIGTFFGLHPLGIYQRALRTQELPVNMIAHLTARVMFPVMSAVNDDHDELRAIAGQFTRQIMFIAVPMMIGLAIVSDLFIAVVFGDQWLPAVPILSVLCLAGTLWPLHVVNVNLLKSLGHSKLIFRVEVIKKSLGIAFIIGGSVFGVMGIAWAAVALAVVSMLINGHYSAKFLNFGLFRQLAECAPTIASSAIMAASVYLVRNFYVLDGPVGLVVFSGVGVGAYLLCQMIWGRSMIIETKQMILGGAAQAPEQLAKD